LEPTLPDALFLWMKWPQFLVQIRTHHSYTTGISSKTLQKEIKQQGYQTVKMMCYVTISWYDMFYKSDTWTDRTDVACDNPQTRHSVICSANHKRLVFGFMAKSKLALINQSNQREIGSSSNQYIKDSNDKRAIVWDQTRNHDREAVL